MFQLRGLISFSVVMLLAIQSTFADLDPQANGLPGGLIIRRQAVDFDALVRQTKPDFVWYGVEMLWITRDASGKPVFTMDHAYTVLLTGRRDTVCCLFDNHGYADLGGEGPAYSYTHVTEAQPTKVAQDPKWGTIYQARWPSVAETGSGGCQYTRNIFLLCDGAGQWHRLGEGPLCFSGRDGAADSTVDTVEADVRWTGDAAHPADLSFTLLSTHEWEPDDKTTLSMTVRCKIVATTDDSLLGGFKRQRPYYVIASRSESLASFAAEVAHCWGLDLGVWGLRYGGEKLSRDTNLIYKEIENALLQTDPAMTGGVKAGAKIVMPDRLNKGEHADRKDWLPPQAPLLANRGG